jgi:enterochelin esterase-like enzyme
MHVENCSATLLETIKIDSKYLDRAVRIDLYRLPQDPSGQSMLREDGTPASGPGGNPALLLINDGQDLERLGLAAILDELYGRGHINPLFCVGIHAGADRKMEYGTAGVPDYQGRGARAGEYSRFVFEELLPVVHERSGIDYFAEKAFAGFSLGALSAMDIVWSNPAEFSKAGLFSGSFWWRTKDREDGSYQDETDRIMHRRVRESAFRPGLRFYFECGTQDEGEDRNGNGVIDSIDDTQDLIRELVLKGYEPNSDIQYTEIEGGRHDVETWARAMPDFLEWGWGKKLR